MLTRPGDFPDTTIPAPATDTVSKMIMAYLDPQRVVVAEQSTVKRFPDELDKLQPEFGKQLLAVYKLAGAFDKSSIRHFSYCTAILHRANVWAARPLVQRVQRPAYQERAQLITDPEHEKGGGDC